MTMTETSTLTAWLSGTTAATVGRCLINVGTVASKDLARGVLAGIHVGTTVDPVTDRMMLTFTATDSYRLIHVTVPTAADDVVRTFDPFVIDAKQAGKVGKLITRKNAGVGVTFTVTGPVFTLSTADGSGNVDLLTGHWPDTARLLTPENTGDLPRIDADLLAGLLSAMSGVISVSRDTVAHVDIDSVSMRQPMRLSATVPDVARVEAVIMPVRR